MVNEPLIIASLILEAFFSCGDDGKIKGWRWKEFTESEVPVTFQGTSFGTV